MRMLQVLLVLALSGPIPRNLLAAKFKHGCPSLPPPLDNIAETHPIDNKCGRDGASKVAEKIAESRAKNDYCRTGHPVMVGRGTFEELQRAVEMDGVKLNDRAHPARPTKQYQTSRATLGEGSVVRFAAWVLKANYSNTRKRPDGSVGENVNCNQPKGENNDIHVVLVESLDDDEEESVTAEIIPHLRPSAWTPTNLLQHKDRRFRFTGQLFLDSSHKRCAPDEPNCGPKRISVWEIHPVYAIEICKSKRAGRCDPGNDAHWMALDQWLEIEAGEAH